MKKLKIESTLKSVFKAGSEKLISILIDYQGVQKWNFSKNRHFGFF